MSEIENVKATILACADELNQALGAVNNAQNVVTEVSTRFLGAIENTAMAEGMEIMGGLDRLSMDVLLSIQTDILRLQQEMQELAARL